MESSYHEIKFSDSDAINKDAFIPKGEYNPHNVRPFLLHDHGFVVAVVFADCLQDALDTAVDEGRMDRFMISEEDRKDYGEDGEGITYLGNASEEFDIQSLGVVELSNPEFSFCAMYNAGKKD